MFNGKLNSPSVKLTILLGIAVALFVFFLILYVKDYFSYYKTLYTYRQNLLESLTSREIAKPSYQQGDPYRGNPRSKIVIFEYSDFSCEACRALQPVLDEIEQFYGSQNVFLVWKDFPVTVAPNNLLAHQAARCAQDQGRFFEYKNALYSNVAGYSRDLFLDVAKQLALDVKAFAECIDTEAKKDVVESSFEEALRLGLDATPTLFINNQEILSGFNTNNLRSIIESTK